MAPAIFTIGYERLLPEALVAELQAAGVARLIDVRYRPQSRRPGMSKTRLGETLADAGITYEHRRSLGTPPDIRWFYRHRRETEGAERYRDHLEATAAAELDVRHADVFGGDRPVVRPVGVVMRFERGRARSAACVRRGRYVACRACPIAGRPARRAGGTAHRGGRSGARRRAAVRAGVSPRRA